MADFLLELRSEEIPARMQDGARAELAKLFASELAKAGLTAARVETFATPRRLVLIAYNLPLETQAVSEETKGPKVGAPPQALEGFLRKTGLTQDQLTERDGVYFAFKEVPPRKTSDILSEAIYSIVHNFTWPKSMRWGAASRHTTSLRWVRPLQGIVALLGDDVIACEVDGITSGRETMGHRFHHSGPININNATTYAAQLRAAHVIVDQTERQMIVRQGAAKAAADAGLTLVADEALVAENAGLTEWPVPLLGRFDASFLAVPPEVIRLTAKLNQKYFMCVAPLPHAGGVGGGQSPASQPTPNPSREREGNLANAFVCTANIEAHDGGKAIIAGNERVLAARLSDAKFFYEQDLKTPLAVHAEKLSNIVFHEKLGTVADKVARVAKLARWLVESGVVQSSPERGGGSPSGLTEGVPSTAFGGPPPRAGEDLAAMAEQAARLCKADLVTGMVGEFPELQGVMGGYYARAQGLPDAVADAIRDHYKPVGQGDDVPTAPVTVAVSLADKLDTLVGFFYEKMPPTGSKDPFALRRAGLAIIALIQENGLRANLVTILSRLVFDRIWEGDRREHILKMEQIIAAKELLRHKDVSVLREFADIYILSPDEYDWIETEAKVEALDVLDFFIDRFKVQQRDLGIRHDLIEAAFVANFDATNLYNDREDDLVRLLARVKALQAFIITEDGANLLAGYKRAANILKSSPERGGGSPSGLTEGAPSTAFDGPPPRAGEDIAHERAPAESALLAALNAAEPQVDAALAAEDFTQAMSVLATLRQPIDAFFTDVMVNDPNPEIRAFRLSLLDRFRVAVHKVADFSKIEG
jgi:glycyl-tRNA synthetase beta chain